MSLREDVELYTKLSGEDGSQETIATMGAYLRGYRQGKEDAEPPWISVADRLPETDDPVLITLYDRTVCEAIFVYHTHDRSYWVKTESGYDYECNEVTAWMPLPEPYKEVAE